MTDTQEAPKSLGLDSSSSTESLNEDVNDNAPTVNNTQSQIKAQPPPQQRSVSPLVPAVSKPILSRPPLPYRRAPIASSGGAFTSYVRRRGEPDGGRTECEGKPLSMQLRNCGDNSQSNTTDSELSDGYTSQTLNKFEMKPKMGYSSLRGPIKVGRPGGGGESDAAFTPSPPIAADNNVSLALAHQTRIRNLYSASNIFSGAESAQMHSSRRPDSSSSASSTTDWEGSGHATVLRRANQSHNHQMLPPLPPPRQTMPLVDSLRPLAPLAPVYNNMGNKGSPKTGAVNALESTSSDSDFERGFDLPVSSILRGRNKMKPLQQFLSRKITDQMDFMDRLSVRTELASAPATNNVHSVVSPRKPPITMPDDDNALTLNANKLYFSPAENETTDTKKEMIPIKADPKLNGAHNKNIQDSILRHMNREMTPTISEVYHERSLGLGLAPPLSKLLLSKNYDDDDTSQMASSGSTVMNNLKEAVNDLDLNSVVVQTGGTSIVASATNTSSISSSSTGDCCKVCSAPKDLLCSCNSAPSSSSSSTGTTKKHSSKPWLSNVIPNIIKNSDLTTADIWERQNKIKSNNITVPTNPVIGNGAEGKVSTMVAAVNSVTTSSTSAVASLKRSNSPFSDLSRRDDGDGRSVADSQCSGNYKVDVAAVQQQIRNKFSS